MDIETEDLRHVTQIGKGSFNWRCNTLGLLKEIAGNNGIAILKVPLNIFKNMWMHYVHK